MARATVTKKEVEVTLALSGEEAMWLRVLTGEVVPGSNPVGNIDGRIFDSLVDAGVPKNNEYHDVFMERMEINPEFKLTGGW